MGQSSFFIKHFVIFMAMNDVLHSLYAIQLNSNTITNTLFVHNKEHINYVNILNNNRNGNSQQRSIVNT